MRDIFKKQELGFTLLEIIVSLSLFSVIIILIGSMFSLSQRSYTKGSDESELAQNSRVSVDRISREIRQSIYIVSNLPATSTDPNNPPANEIFFQNGHDISAITYIRYYLDGSNLMRNYEAYYFPSDPSLYVKQNALNQYNELPDQLILESRVIGEYVDDLQFWGDKNLVYFKFNYLKGQNRLEINSSVQSRN